MNQSLSSSCVIGVGTDIIEIARIKAAIERHGMRFYRRIFSLDEEEYCKKFLNPYPHLAGRFAAKEAVMKALGSIWNRPIGWQQITICKEPNGRPTVSVDPSLAKNFIGYQLLISISHSREFATAMALLSKLN